MELLVVLASALVNDAAAFVAPVKNSARLSMVASNNFVRPSSSLLDNLRGGVIAATPKARPAAFLVGNVSAVLKTLISRWGAAYQRAEAAFHLSDLAVILFLSFLPEIIFRFVTNEIVNKTIRRKDPVEFEDTLYVSKLSTILCQLGQLGLLVYVGELFMVFLGGLGVPRLNDKPKLFAGFVFGFWTANLVCKFKAHLIDRAVRRYSNRGTKLASKKVLYNRFLDAAIYLITTLLLMDANNIDVGVALASLLTLGGVSSVVVGLALKEPVTEIIQGTSVLLSDKFSTGDIIRLSDGTSGKVQDMRWTDITIRGNDNSFVRIPHSQIAKNRIVNLSRMPHSQVSQEISLPNHGSAKIQNLHRIARLKNEYYDTRQNVLMAISRAVERYNKN